MDARTWDSAKSLFASVVETAPGERAPLLAAEGIDPEVRELVRAMLAADAVVGDAPVVPAVAQIDRIEQVVDRRLEGACFGDYRIQRLIGRGGMGVVYLAEREQDGATQRVALKLVRSARMDAEGLRRFAAERNLLARLDHPSIARLIDVGRVDGVPFYAMEYVDGEPITGYADGKALGVRARLKLLCRVCDAVSHAHRSLIVHRDVKPTNVLVDREGRPRLLDFGIAKALDRDAAAEQDTATQHRFISPHCTAPEVLRGGPVTTACDTYALGALLYELLCGVPALTFESTTLADIEQVILQRSPQRPSERLQHLAAGVAARVARERGLSSAALLRQRLRGDLDTIVLRALAKEPERRYPSVEAFADDLRRHLDDLPVRARPDRLGYRTAKFVRRRRWPLAVVATVLVAAAAISVLAWRQSQAIRLERDVALAERTRAERVSDFLTDTFAMADPTQTLGDSVTVRQILDQAMLRLDPGGDGAGQGVDPSLLVTMASAYVGLGRFEPAEAIARRALAAATDAADRQAAHHLLAEVLNARGRFDDALLHAREAAALTGPRDARAILAPILFNLGKADEAETVYRALHADRSADAPDSIAHADAAVQLARHLRNQREHDEARQLLEGALRTQRRLLPAGHPALAETLSVLASVERARGDLSSAITHARESLAIQQRVYGERHPAVGRAWGTLGNVLDAAGDPAGAADAMREALAQARAFNGEQSALAAMTHYSLGRILHSGLDRPAEAETQFRAAIDAAEASGAVANLVFYRLGLATALNAQARHEEAIAILEPVRRERLARDGAGTLNVAYVESELAEALRRSGRFSESIEMLERVVPLMTTRLGEDNTATRVADMRLSASRAGDSSPLDPPSNTQGD